MCVCVRASVRVRARVRACVCVAACVRACLHACVCVTLTTSYYAAYTCVYLYIAMCAFAHLCGSRSYIQCSCVRVFVHACLRLCVFGICGARAHARVSVWLYVLGSFIFGERMVNEYNIGQCIEVHPLYTHTHTLTHILALTPARAHTHTHTLTHTHTRTHARAHPYILTHRDSLSHTHTHQKTNHNNDKRMAKIYLQNFISSFFFFYI